MDLDILFNVSNKQVTPKVEYQHAHTIKNEFNLKVIQLENKELSINSPQPKISNIIHFQDVIRSKALS